MDTSTQEGSTQEDAPPRTTLHERLQELCRAAGDPPQKAIANAASRYSVKPVSEQRVSDWTRGKAVPQKPEQLQAVVRGLLDIARSAGRSYDPSMADLDDWRTLRERAQVRKSSPNLSRCPYMGLASFGADDGERFHGRRRSLDELVGKLEAGSTGHGLFVLYAASGSGKTSLLHAGLIATATTTGLLGTNAPWRTATFTPGADPLSDLHAALGASATDAAMSASLRPTADGTAGTLLVIDQFEQIFTACTEPGVRREFIETLSEIAAATTDEWPCLVVLGLRADFVPDCLPHPQLREALAERQIVLGPMTPDELTEAIREPAAACGMKLEPGLAAAILSDLAVAEADHQVALPLLSHVLQTMWLQLRPGDDMLTLAQYQKVGAIAGSVDATAQRAWGQLDYDERTAARQVLLSLVQIGDGTRDTRRTVPKSELISLGGQADSGYERVVEVLTDARLLTVGADGGVAFTHEVVISSWQLLRTWIDADRSAHLAHQRLANDAKEWDRAGRHSSDLYRGPRLAEITEKRGERQLTELSEQFLEASEDALARKDTSAKRRRQASVAAAVVIVAIMVSGWIKSVHDSSEATASRNAAQFHSVLYDADRQQLTNPALSAQLDLVAQRLRPGDPQSASRLLSTQSAPMMTPAAGHIGAIYTAAFRPDGKVVATASADHTARLWDLSNPAAPKSLGTPLTGHSDFLTSATWSPNGKLLATASGDKTIRLWDVSDPAHPHQIGQPLTTTPPHGAIYVTSITPDGRTLAAPADDGSTIIWDISNPERPVVRATLTGPTAPVRTTAISPDGKLLAVGSDDHSVWLWNIANPSAPVLVGPPLTGFSRTVHSVAFSPDGTALAAASDDTTFRLWNVSDPAHPTEDGGAIAGGGGALWSVAFGPDSRTLITGSWDGTARMWNLTDPSRPHQMGQPYTGSRGGVISAAISPDGRTVITGSQDGVLRVWNRPPAVLDAHTDRVVTPRFTADGSRMVTASVDGSIQVWDTSNPANPIPLGRIESPTEEIDNLVLARDGRTALTVGGSDRAIRLWDISDPRAIRPLRDPLPGARYAYAMAISPNGRTLATAGRDDNTIQLWDIATIADPTPIGAPITVPGDLLTSLAFSPEGRTLAASAQGSSDVAIFDVSDRTHPHQLPPLRGHTRHVESLAFSPVGNTLASGSDDQTVRLWDLTDPAHAKADSKPLTGATSTVRSLTFSPDGRMLAAGTDSGTVQLWSGVDTDSPTPLGGSITPSTNGVRWYVAFRPGSGSPYLTAGGEGGAVRVWSTSTESAADRICAYSAGILTKDVWDTELPGQPYDPPCRN